MCLAIEDKTAEKRMPHFEKKLDDLFLKMDSGRSRLRTRRPSERLLVDIAANSLDISSPVLQRFMFEAEEVQQYMAKHGLTTKQLLKSMVQPASLLARPPISAFNVGAVGMGASGRVFVGVNVEFARLPLSNSIHAEQFLLVNMKHHHEEELVMVAVNAAPCGHCRQFYSELACSDTVQFVFGDGDDDQFSLDQLLPHRFRPEDLLGSDPPPLLLKPQRHALAFTDEAERDIATRMDDEDFLRAAHAAHAEAEEAYTPYSRCPAGVALITDKGDVYSGGYIESAAYNPSLPPLQTAVVDAIIDHMPALTHIREVIIVEGRDAAVRHERGIQSVLSQMAADATLTVLPVRWRDDGEV